MLALKVLEISRGFMNGFAYIKTFNSMVASPLWVPHRIESIEVNPFIRLSQTPSLTNGWLWSTNNLSCCIRVKNHSNDCFSVAKRIKWCLCLTWQVVSLYVKCSLVEPKYASTLRQPSILFQKFCWWELHFVCFSCIPVYKNGNFPSLDYSNSKSGENLFVKRVSVSIG